MPKAENTIMNSEIKYDTEKQKIEVVLQPVVTPTPEPLSEGTPATANVAMEETMPFGAVVEEVVDTPNSTLSDPSQNEQKAEEKGVQPEPAPSVSEPLPSEEKSEEQSVQPEPIPCV